MNISTASNCIEKMKVYRQYNGEKIGLLCRDFDHHQSGSVILFKNSNDSTVTVLMPLNEDQIQSNLKQSRLVFATECLVNVPKQYIKEINGVM